MLKNISIISAFSLCILSVFVGQTYSAAEDLGFPGVSIHYALPAGFCPPTGKYINIYRNLYGTSRDQILLAGSFRCEAMAAGKIPTEDFVFKTTPAALHTDMGNRASMLRLSQKTNGGSDDFGVYTVKTSELRSGDKVVHTMVVGATTVVKRRVVILDFSSASQEPLDADRALKFVKDQARMFVEENEQ